MTETKKSPADGTSAGDRENRNRLREYRNRLDPGGDLYPPCESHADVEGWCGQCDPVAIAFREMNERKEIAFRETNELIEERDRQREQDRQQTIEEYLTGRYAVYAPSEAALDDFLSVLDREETEGLEDGETVESTSCRLFMRADAEGRVWANDGSPLDADLLDTPSEQWTAEQRERYEAHLDQDPPHVLFFTVDERTAVLLSAEHHTEHPDVRVFSACVGLPFGELSTRFHGAGLDLDDFAPTTVPAWTLTADTVEWLTDTETDEDKATEEGDATTDRDEDNVTDEELAPNAPLDLRRLRTEPRKPVEYLEPGMYPRGRYVGLSGEAGAGKSILVRDMAVHWSLGRSALDPNHRFEPAQVVYLDAENGPDWWHEGLDKMDAPLDLPNLRVICYPELADGLDTERGARSFLELVESLGDIDVLILDTISRFVSGGENDSDTWHGVYRNAILPLRRAGIGVLRLDHIGKNAELGARGSSAKMSDLDAHFMLSAPAKGSNDLTLKLDKRRQADYAETAKLTRRDGPLGHLRLPDGKLIVRIDEKTGREVPEDPKVAALVAELDRLHISAALTRDVQQEMYREKGGKEKARGTVWTAARKFRSERIDRESERR